MKQVIQLDDQGYYMGVTVAHQSPLEPGVYLMPANTVNAAVPGIPAGCRARWDGKAWVMEKIPTTPAEIIDAAAAANPDKTGPTYIEKRSFAFMLEADPLYFQEQRGEVPAGTWGRKIAEIKRRYPKETDTE